MTDPDLVSHGSFEPLHPSAADASSPLVTHEVRWFASGPIPLDAVRWFESAADGIDVDERVDSYLLTGRPEIGVKRRDHGPLETKTRRRVLGTASLGDLLVAPIEEWAKTRHHDDARSSMGRWIDLEKTVMTWLHAPDGTSPKASTCEAELAAVDGENISGWTLAFEAQGPQRLDALHSTLDRFDERFGLPGKLASELSIAAGYPEWLLEISTS